MRHRLFGSHESLETNLLRLFLMLILALVTVVIGILVREYKFGPWALLLTFLVTCILGIGPAYLALRENAERIREQITGVLDSYRAELIATRAGWLVSGESLDSFEAKCDANHIIIASADLDHDVPGARMAPIVSKNLHRGIRYTYIIGQVPSVLEKARLIRAANPDCNDGLRFVKIDPGILAGLTDTNLTAYCFPGSREPMVYTELPNDPDSDKRFWVRLHLDYALIVLGRLRAFAEAAATDAGSGQGA